MNDPLSIHAFGFPFGVGGGGSCTSDAPKVLVQNGLIDVLSEKGRGVTYEDLSLRYPSLLMPASRIHGRPNVKHLFQVRNALRYAYLESCIAHMNDEVPLFIGGDHTLAAATICGSLKKYGQDLRVIYVDQHGDVHDQHSSPTKNAHGMPLALAMGYGDDRLLAAGGIAPRQRKLLPTQLMHVGADPESVEDAEVEFLNRLNVKQVTLTQTQHDGYAKLYEEVALFAKGSPVHVSFDIDATDAPGTGYRGKRGYSCAQSVALVEAIRNAGTVVSVDMVEYCPDKDEPDVDGASYVTINYIKDILRALLA